MRASRRHIFVCLLASCEFLFSALFNFTVPAGAQIVYNTPVQVDPYGASFALLLGPDGNFYGNSKSPSSANLFKLTPGGMVTGIPNSEFPWLSLAVGPDGNIYGTTEFGTGNLNGGSGQILNLTPDGGIHELFDFGSGYYKQNNVTGSWGSEPNSLAIGKDGNFYGTTASGGANFYDGTVFLFTNAPGATSVSYLFNFNGTNTGNGYDGIPSDGESPNCLIAGLDGNLYGTTLGGAVPGQTTSGFGYFGTVFRVATDGTEAGTTLTTLVDFNGTDGSGPNGGLVIGPDGNFYGVTSGGGIGSDGTVFKTSSGGNLTTLVNFVGANGSNPVGPLAVGPDGNFYGLTNAGGANNVGTIFQVTPSGTLNTLYSFSTASALGYSPIGGLTLGNDGNIYGSTNQGGANQLGTMFKFTPGPTLNPTTGILSLLDANIQYTKVDLSDSYLSSLNSDSYQNLANASHMCRAAVADGATKVLLKYIAPSSGSVSFTEATVNSTQPYPYSTDKLETLAGATPAVGIHTQLLNGQYVAFALYATPDTLPSATAGKTNPVQFTANFTADGSSSPSSTTASLPLWHTPVLLIHGIWSSPSTWDNTTGVMAALKATGIGGNNGPYEISKVDYSDYVLSSFAFNQTVLLFRPGGIAQTLSAYRNMGAAISQVDVVAHSMGGILAREFAGNSFYYSSDNFGKGYVHRFITIGTPHLGSKLANVLVGLANGPFGSVWQSAMAAVGCPYGDAVENLQYGSPETLAIPAMPAPSFAEVGVSNFPTTDYALDSMYNSLSTFPFLVFPGEQSDLIVGESSQIGGLPSSAYYTTATSTDHLQETSSSEIGTSIASLLTNPNALFDEVGFTSQANTLEASSYYQTDETSRRTIMTGFPAETMASFVTINSPINQQIFQPGDTVTVTTVPQAGTTLAGCTAFVGPPNNIFGTQSVTAAPFTATFTIPTTYVGDLPINVFATDTSGNVCLVSEDCSVQTQAALSALSVSAPSTSLSSLSAVSQLAVSGTFSDSVTRDITSSVIGTMYVSSDSTVISVSSDGLVSAVGSGYAEITVTNGVSSAKITFVVLIVGPNVSSVSPTSTLPGTNVSLSLVGYNLTGTTSLQFDVNGIPDPSITATDVTVGSTGSNLSANISIGTNAIPGVHIVTVTTGAGTSNAYADPTLAGFTVNSTPGITSFTPTSAVQGTKITITGTNFTGTTYVRFNGASTSFTLNSATLITATVPSKGSSGLISVTTPGGTCTSSTSFTYTYPPTVSSFTPTSGVQGTKVIITGTNFTGATYVRFNGASTSFTLNSTTQITASVPSKGSTGTISVTSPSGTATSNQTFTYSSVPTIKSFTPTSAAQGTKITITGSGFTGATYVRFNGASTSFSINADTSITATVPSKGSTGTITVTSPSGTGTSSTSFTYLFPPTVSSFTPTSGVGGNIVVIIGTNFNGVTYVRFNGASTSFTVNSPTQITAIAPGKGTTGSITVTTPSGTGTSATSFTYSSGT